MTGTDHLNKPVYKPSEHAKRAMSIARTFVHSAYTQPRKVERWVREGRRKPSASEMVSSSPPRRTDKTARLGRADPNSPRLPEAPNNRLPASGHRQTLPDQQHQKARESGEARRGIEPAAPEPVLSPFERYAMNNRLARVTRSKERSYAAFLKKSLAKNFKQKAKTEPFTR